MTACLLLALALPAEPNMAAKIEQLAAAHKGKVAVAVRHLGTGESYTRDADTPMQTASLIKLAIMAAAYQRSDEGKLDLARMVTLTRGDKVPGSGILTDHFTEGATLCVRDLVRLMIRYSDNTATNMVLDQVGIRTVNEYTAARGMPETRINAKVFKGSTTSVDPERTKKYSLGSTTASESVRLLELIHANKAASQESCQTMLAHLRSCDDADKLPRKLPLGTMIAHKTGSTNQVRTDAGIIYVPDPTDPKKAKQAVAVCVLTNENQDQRWVQDNAGQVVIADIGRAVYDYFAKKPVK